MRSTSSYLSEAEDDQASANRRSIRVQTSKHLFWADKLIQTSEHSLQRVLHRQPRKNTGKTSGCQDRQCVPGDAMCSKKQLQNSGAQPAPPATDSRQPPNPHPSSSSLSPGIGLADVVNFASSLAVASSSKRDLPSLEHRIRAPPQKPEAPSTDPAVRRATDQPEGKNLSKELLEKPLRAGESQKAWKQEDKNFLHPYLDFSKPGMKRATIEGQVKLLQQPARSPPPQGAVKEQQKAEDREIPVVSTGNVQVTRAGEASAGTSYCPQNPLERGLWVQAGVGVLGGGGAEPEPPQTWSQPPYPQSEPRVGGAPQSCLLPAPKASTAASKTAQTGPRRGAAPRGAEREASAAHCPADPEAASIRQGHRG
uniref:Spermatogenesis-associated protein 32 n=1 Tax=Ursus maritimus TaxID=29073 RepID=A0A452UIF6_URSMA